MHIELQHTEGFHFIATNAEGSTVQIEGSSGKAGQGVSPMQLLVIALGGCSGIDVVSILEKGRQPLEGLKIEIEANQVRGKDHSWFDGIHLHFALQGNLDEKRVRRAVNLSMDKYCSVAKILEKATSITSSFSINGKIY